MSQISFTRLCVHGCIGETTFQLSLYIYRLKTIRQRKIVVWRNLTDRNESQMTTLNARIDWSVCRNTDNNECGLVHFSPMTSNFLTMLASKHHIWGLKLPKWTKQLFNIDIMASSGLSGSMEEDFPTESQLWKKVHQTRNQNTANVQKRVTATKLKKHTQEVQI